MPPPRIQMPGFSPVGRYLLDVDLRKISLLSSLKTEVHDTQNFQDGCEIGDIPTGSQSRFDNLGWALQRGFVRCSLCFPVNIRTTSIQRSKN